MQRKIVKYSSAALCVFISMSLLFAPFNVNILKGALIEKNEAQAIAPAFAGAYSFLEVMAAGAGLSVSEMVATITGYTAVAAGMNIATDAGISYGNTASDNLANLIDAADYPAWSSLSSSEQTLWGSQENYDASKFNSLMTAFGFGDAYGRYQNGWGQGGNSQFSFSSAEQSTLDHIGNIGQNWIDGVGNLISDMRGNNLVNTNQIQAWAPPVTGQLDASNLSDWPSGFSTNVNYTLSSSASCSFRGAGNVLNNKSWSYSQPVYVMGYMKDNYLRVRAFSNSTFSRSGSDNSSSPITNSYNQETIYWYNNGFSSVSNLQSSFPVNSYTSDPNESQFARIAYAIIHNENPLTDNKLSGYPSNDIQNGVLNDTVVYFPSSGMDNQTNWEDLISHQEEITEDLSGIITLLRHIDSDLHNFNFYSNGELKVFDNGVFEELSDIYTLLIEISGKLTNWGDIADAPDIIGDFDFDDISDRVPNLLEVIENVAPFGAMLILTELYTVISSIDPIDEPEFVVPFKFGGLDDNQEITIDLSWMDDIKPVINFFCILMLLLAMTRVTMRIVELEAAS